jgi:hypothetical protein
MLRVRKVHYIRILRIEYVAEQSRESNRSNLFRERGRHNQEEYSRTKQKRLAKFTLIA